jgi:DedD protein
MAFLKSRNSGDESSAVPILPESVEAVRRRAKHRLIGSAVLVLAGVIVFPLLFDQQPRPVAVDIPIEIPDRNKVKPLSLPAVPTLVPASIASPVAVPAPAPAQEIEEILSTAPATVAVSAPKPVPMPAPKVDQAAAKAPALPNGQESPKPSAEVASRYVVQVGAFAELARAQEVRLKVERAGLKTYTHVADTKEGRRTRVRVGPFTTKADAERAAEKIRRLDLPATILTL